MRRFATLATAVLLALTGLAAAAADGGNWFQRLDDLAPEERFRQLSLMLMVSDGADEVLIGALRSQLQALDDGDENQDAPVLDFDAYTTPLIRIVDQETMLAGAARLFRFTRDHAAGVAGRLRQLQQDNPAAVQTGSEYAISEDAIIIRNAIADSIDYAEHAGGGEEARVSRNYRARTVYLRNNLEYELFAAELERITREAVASVGGKTDAYERMFDEEVDSAALDKKIQAAEYAYGWDREFDERAARLAEEILNNIWDQESDF